MGVRIRAVMTDNARVFQSKRFQRALRWLGIRHKTTPPYTLGVILRESVGR